MLLPCKYAVPMLLTPLAFFLWDLQATIFRNSYLIKKEKMVCGFSVCISVAGRRGQVALGASGEKPRCCSRKGVELDESVVGEDP